jgi:hypothetical protein
MLEELSSETRTDQVPLAPLGSLMEGWRAADRPLESYDRMLLAPEQLLEEAQRVGDAGVREWAALATMDAIDLGEELGMLWDDEAERRPSAVRDVDRRLRRCPEATATRQRPPGAWRPPSPAAGPLRRPASVRTSWRPSGRATSP